MFLSALCFGLCASAVIGAAALEGVNLRLLGYAQRGVVKTRHSFAARSFVPRLH
jgi:hypothetical protein